MNHSLVIACLTTMMDGGTVPYVVVVSLMLLQLLVAQRKEISIWM